MNINDLLGFYSSITDTINFVSGEISSFAEEVSDVINFDFSVPEPTEFPTNLTRYSDPLVDFSHLPQLTSDYPDFEASPENYKATITELRHAVDGLLNTLQDITPDLGCFELNSLPDPPNTDINPDYPSLTLEFGNIPSPPNIPDLNIPSIPNLEEISVAKEKHVVEDIISYFESLANYIGQIKQLLQNQSIDVDTDFPNGVNIAPAKKTLEDWLECDYNPTMTKLTNIDLDGLADAVAGTNIDSYRYYMLPDGFVEAVMDFAENIEGLDLIRKEPLSYLDSLRLSREIEDILGEATVRGFNEDVIDERVAYDITLHRIQTQLGLTEKKGKILSSCSEQMWKAVDRKPKLYNQLSTWLLVSYYSLVDNILKLYQVKIKTIQERIDLVDKAIKANQSRLQILSASALNLFANIETQIRNFVSKLKSQVLEIQSETLISQADLLESQAIVKKITEYVQKIRITEAKLKEIQSRLSLYEVKAGLFESQLRFEVLKNNQVILENQNNVLSTLTQFIDYDKLVEQYRLLANIQEGKLSVFNDYISYLITVVSKLTQTPKVVKLRGRLKNLQAQINKFLVQRQAKDTVMNTWQASLSDRWTVDSYDYKKLMQKIVYDAQAAVTFAETHLIDRMAKASGKFNTLGEYYSKKVAGALSAAHTVVGITNRILEG